MLSALMDLGPDGIPHLKGNVSFITWNYDLQLERTFSKLATNEVNWDRLPDLINFHDVDNIEKPIRVLHLNGFHGFTKGKDHRYGMINHLGQVPPKTMAHEMLDGFGKIAWARYSHFNENEGSKYDGLMNFAWESSSAQVINKAKEIVRNTDNLIVVGYSFPRFNRHVDQALLSELRKSGEVRVVHQDKSPKTGLISQLVPKYDRGEPYCKIMANEELGSIFMPEVF